MKLLLAVTVILLPFLISPVQVMACSCVAPGSPTEELSKSTAVFSGKVTSVDNYEGFRSVDFEANQSWKGSTQSTLSLITGADSAGCGYEFEVGKSYLVYATESEGKLYASLCSRTNLLADASSDIQSLGEGKLVSAPSGASSNPIVAITIGILVLGSAALGVVYLIRKSNPRKG